MPGSSFPPGTLEFQQLFPDEEACFQFMMQTRFPDGFVCPRCGFKQHYLKETRRLLQCKRCAYQVSVTAGTILHRSKIPLKTWLHAAYLVTSCQTGISALEFQKQAGLAAYETAFNLLHKLRKAMSRPVPNGLTGVVEVDATYIGGRREGMSRLRTTGKAVAGALEVMGKNTNRLRLWAVPDLTADTLTRLIKTGIVEGSTVRTLAWTGNPAIAGAGYTHQVLSHLPHIETVFSDLNAWLLETHHGSVRRQHLQAYLNEFAFRFNRRNTPEAAFRGVGFWEPSPYAH